MNMIPAAICLLCILAPSVTVVADQPIGGDMGAYRVNCNVDGASVYFDGTFKGLINQGVLIVPVYTTGTPYKSFTVSKQGYITYNGAVLSVPAAGSTTDLYATLDAVPTETPGNLNVLTDPPLCEIYINGVLSGTSDSSGVYLKSNIKPGTYTLEVRKTGYGTVTKTVTIPEDSMIKVSVTLNRISTGSIAVTTTPAGANIYIDDVYKGVAPLTIQDATAGEHRMTVKAPGYQDMTIMVTVIAGQTTPVTASLTMTPPLTPKATATKSPVPVSVAVLALCGAVLVFASSRRK